MGLTRKVVAGAGVLTVAQAVRQVLAVGAMVLLARWLAPEQFGVLALATILSNFGVILVGLGATQAIIHRNEPTDAAASTYFFTSQAASAVFFGGLALLAGPMGEVLHVPAGVWYVAAAAGWARALAIIPRALVTKRLEMGQVAVLETCCQAAWVAAALAGAAAGWGLWSLAAAMLAQGFLEGTGFWIVCRWRPSLHWRWAEQKAVLGYGGGATGAACLYFWTDHIDYLLVGALMGHAPLGLYERSFHLVTLPARKLSEAVGRTLFPAYSELAGDRRRLRRAYGRTVKGVALLAVPAMAGLLVVADDLVATMLGEQWLAAVPLIRLLSVIGVLTALDLSSVSLLWAIGRSGATAALGALRVSLIVTGVLIGLPFGLPAVALGVVLSTVAYRLCCQAVVNRAVGLSLREYLDLLAPGGAAALLVAAAVALPRWLLAGAGLGAELRFLLTFVCGSAAFAAFAGIAFRGKVAALLARRRAGRRAPLPV
jgi:PST family polysaccharide transporter